MLEACHALREAGHLIVLEVDFAQNGPRERRLQLLDEIHKPEADLGHIEALIEREVSLPLKVLTYMNLAAFGFRQRIASVRHALMLLGLRGIRDVRQTLLGGEATCGSTAYMEPPG